MMTVFTIVYNNYGKFLPNWIENMQTQTVKPKIIIVLGKNHGANEDLINKMLKHFDHKIIYSESDVMGTLRNLAIKEIETEWMLYFSVDDKLLSNAVEEITSEECDVVALRFINKEANGREYNKKSGIFTKENIKNWRELTAIPGYIAVKGKYYYEDIEIPNYPYMFQLASKGLKQKHSKNICAIYQRRTTSHGYQSSRKNRFIEFIKIINQYADFYTKEEK